MKEEKPGSQCTALAEAQIGVKAPQSEREENIEGEGTASKLRNNAYHANKKLY